ncbi:HNH endonuclease signature motif containing protein [uncultured Microbacterium sp.]|uniref:HNH endonuclease signature motif containing protein n=1 Tax=uncultured Microbacterium sp. TaxID=191216 RepID=UPI0026141B72|nr:HNH endonuclease signature motif containing protein [uncultured Microbacterium sp.]
MSSSTEPTSSPDFTPGDLRALGAVTDRVIAARKARAAADAAEIRALAEAMELAARRQAALGPVSSRQSDLPVREIAAELAAAVRASDRTVQARLGDAADVVARFARAVEALAAGGIDRGHLVAITEAGGRISDDEARAVFEEAALSVCRRETPGRARPILRVLAQQIDPIAAQERHDTAAGERRAWVTDGDDGMADLTLRAPAVIAHGAFDRATQIAHAIIDARHADTAEREAVAQGADASPTRDTRTLNQIRADVLADLLLTGHATPAESDGTIPVAEAIVARVQITIPAATIEGGDAPAELAGSGPLDAESARCLAATARTWTRLYTDPSGCVLAVDQYRPPSRLRKLLAARDEHCRFPGCRQPIWRCDVDHTIDHALGGATEVCNLAHLCRRHHVLKHHTAWTVKQKPGGILEWTSPTGRVYPDVPARVLTFAVGPPPPF